MCIQSVGEKSALNAIFLGPPSSSMMAISGGTMQSYCSSRFFDFFGDYSCKDSSFGIHRWKPKWNIRPSFRSLLLPSPKLFKKWFLLETETSALFALHSVDLVGFFLHAVAGHHLAAKCRPCQGVSSSSGFGIFCAQAWSFSSSLKSAARAARAAVTL